MLCFNVVTTLFDVRTTSYQRQINLVLKRGRRIPMFWVSIFLFLLWRNYFVLLLAWLIKEINLTNHFKPIIFRVLINRVTFLLKTFHLILSRFFKIGLSEDLSKPCLWQDSSSLYYFFFKRMLIGNNRQ